MPPPPSTMENSTITSAPSSSTTTIRDQIRIIHDAGKSTRKSDNSNGIPTTSETDNSSSSISSSAIKNSSSSSSIQRPDSLAIDQSSASSSSSTVPSSESELKLGIDKSPSKKPRTHLYQLSAEKEERLRNLYKQLDIDDDGTVDIDDLTEALQDRMPNIPESPMYAKQIMEQADETQTHNIDFSEFVHYIMEHEKNLAVTFRDLDRNSDGLIDSKDLKSYFHRLGMIDVTDKEAEQIIRKMDHTNRKVVSLDDFQRYFILHPSSSPIDIAKYWRRHLYIDMGEETGIPPDDIERTAWMRHLLAGGIAGAVSRTSTAPLDRLKVFLQVYASRNNSYRVVTSLRYLLGEGGWRALWRGNGVNVFKIVPESAIKFTVYEEVKQLLKKSHSNIAAELSGFEKFLAGSCAGAVSQTAIYPLEVLKTRLALRKTGEMNRGMLNAFLTIRQKEGWRAFTRGYFPNLLGIIPYAGTDLAVYETLKKRFIRRHPDIEPSVFVLLGCGICSSSCGLLVSYPLALVRTRLQAHALRVAEAHPETMIGQFTHIIRQEGVTGLYRGLTPNFMKVLPAVGISYVVYETLRKRLGVEMTS